MFGKLRCCTLLQSCDEQVVQMERKEKRLIKVGIIFWEIFAAVDEHVG